MKIKDATAQYKAMATVTTAVSTLLLGSLSYALLLPDVNEANAETNVSVGTSGYTLAVSSSTSGKVNMSLNPTASGVFTMTKETLNTRTNAEGFSMYIGMQGDTNDLYLNGDTSSTALPATSSSASYASPSTIGTNSWGYAIPQSSTMPIDGGTLVNNNLASGNGFSAGSYVDNSMEESNTKWAAVPVKGSEQIIQSTNTANNTDGVDLHVFYATKVNSSQVAGDYKGTVVYTAVAKSNSALIVSSSPSTTKKLDGGETLTIVIGVNTNYSNLTTKTVTISDINGSDTCTITGGGNNPDGTLYLTCTTPAKSQSGFYDINIDLGSYGTYTIADGIEYVYKEPPQFFKITKMQDMTAAICSTVDTPTSNVTNVTADNGSDYEPGGTIVPSHTLTDQRDGQEYTVRKLADGNCWMGENLRFGINPDGTGHPFTGADIAGSDPSLNSTKMLDLTYDSSNPNTAGRIKNGSSGMMAADNSANAFANNSKDYTEPYINIYQANDVADYDGQTKYGVQYNYCAVTGGTACTGYSTDYNPTGSICPKGWKLPGFTASPTGSGATTDGTVKTYDNLLNAYGVASNSAGFNKITPSPLSFVRAGYANDGSLVRRSSTGGGYYWSSTKYSSARYAYYVNFDSGYLGRNASGRNEGLSARCVSE